MHNSNHAARFAASFSTQQVHRASTWTAILANRAHQQRMQAVFARIGPTQQQVPDFPILVNRTVIIPLTKTDEGQLIKVATIPLLAIIERIMKDPSLMYEIDPRKWEEIIAASYDESGLFDEVTLTPRSGDRGRDVIAVKKGFGSVRLIESVKRHKPGTKTTAEEVQALLGVMLSDPQASKGIVSTTWQFAPKILDNPQIAQYIPHRLELVDGASLVERLKEYTTPKSD